MNVKDLSTEAASTRLCRLLLEAERMGTDAVQQALMAELLERKAPLFFMKDPYGTRMDLRTFGDQSNMLAVYSDERCLHWAAKDMGRHPDAFVVAELPPRELFKQAAARSLGLAVFAYEDRVMPRFLLLPPTALTLLLLGAPPLSTGESSNGKLRIDPAKLRLRISLGARIIVDTARVFLVTEKGGRFRHYVRREDVRAELREGTETGNCPVRGPWQSLDVSAGGKTVANGAILYVAPTGEWQALRGHVALLREKMDAFEELPVDSSQEEPEEGCPCGSGLVFSRCHGKGDADEADVDTTAEVTPTEEGEASSLDALADAHFQKGDYGRAEPLLQRALALREKALGPRHSRLAATLNRLGAVYLERGDHLRAEPLLQRALAIAEQNPKASDAEVGKLLSNLAQSYSSRGDYGRAEPLLQRALAIVEQNLDPRDPLVATVVGNLAWLYWAQHDDARAEPLFLRALSIRVHTFGPAHPAVANTLNNLAQIYTRKGDYARAEPLFLRALAILEHELGPEHPHVAFVVDNLASLYSNRGDLAAADDVNAESLHLRALAIREQTLGPLHPQVAVTLNNLAWLHLRRGDVSAAVRAMERALSIEDHHVGLLLTTGSDEQKRASMATIDNTTHGAVTLHLAVAPAAEEARALALTTILRRKGRVLDAMADSFAALRRRRLGVEDRGLLDELRATSAALSAAMLYRPPDANPEGYHDHLEHLDKRRQALEAALSKRGAGAAPAPPEVTVERVQAALPVGSALVEVFRLHPFGDSGRTAPRYVAYVLQREGEIAWADLGEAAIIEAAVARFRHELASPSSHPARAAREFGDALDPDGDPRPAARELDRLIMAPIRRLLGSARDVFVSPDGALNNVPFNALVDEEGRYLVERYTFTYLASGRDLVRLDERTTPSRQGPVVVAAPDYGEKISAPAFDDDPGADRSAEMRGMYFGPLRFAAEEGRAVARKLAGGVLLLGKDATDHAIQALRGPALLHIATHGFFLPDTPAPATPPRDARNDLGGWAPAPRRIENPLVRAGLALAGANDQGRARNGLGLHGHEDGVLTALELAQVDLMGTKLVVLSACGTGLGECRSGDGVYGLRRAVATAGAETQVMSLWSVDDAATSELMQSYYDHLLAGGGRSEAMRQAQLTMLHRPDRAHPFYWASFIVSGNPAPLDGGSLRDGPGGDEPRAERSTSLFMRLKSMLFSNGPRP